MPNLSSTCAENLRHTFANAGLHAQSGTVPSVYDTLRPALAERFPPHTRSPHFNVTQAAEALAAASGNQWDDRSAFYKLRRGERVSDDWLRAVCDLVGIRFDDLPPQPRPQSKPELRAALEESERRNRQLQQELASVTRRLVHLEARTRAPQELPKPDSQRRRGG